MLLEPERVLHLQALRRLFRRQRRFSAMNARVEIRAVEVEER